jgi:23S rRNA (pseudouridine1915-N3)-methyltransferase
MRVQLIAVGERMPAWVDAGFGEYAKRLAGDVRLELRAIRAGARRGGATGRAIEQEGRRMLDAVAKGARVIALEERGHAWTTPQLAERMAQWLASGSDLALLVGGPDGLAPMCLERAELRWSLSPLTLPHPLVRVLVAEQLYRAWSILHHHPYHRA